MKWKNFKLGKKFSIGLGAMIVLLCVAILIALKGIGGIVNNAGEVIDGNRLRSDLEHKYVQHLEWSHQVSELLTNDEVVELDVQMDPHKCAFGQWYYGEGRKEAEKLVPELKETLDMMETPHKNLHASAQFIQDVFVQADRTVGQFLREKKSDHLLWVKKVAEAIISNQSKVDVQKDPTQCSLGKWLASEEALELSKEYTEFKAMIDEIHPYHNALHKSVVDIEKYMVINNRGAATHMFKTQTQESAQNTLNMINTMIAWNNKHLDGMDQANEIYAKSTTTNLNELRGLFNSMIEISNREIMTDAAMLKKANSTKSGLMVFGFLVVVFTILLAFVLVRGIVGPLKKGISFAKEVAGGNLDATVDIDQEDEIGDLAKALRGMIAKLRDTVSNIIAGANNIASASQQVSASAQQLSQGASEQASSVEEVSSTMEQMAANIQQNTDNAQQTDKMSQGVSESITEVSEHAGKAVDANRVIADKIQIINDIAFQTNILALNAAVEAARAGEHGKGFAVVAAEVRKLAERSKVAAEEIVSLAQNTLELAEGAGKKMQETLPQVEKTGKLVQEIAAASLEQNNGTTQVNNALQQLNLVTQQNSAASEELSTSSEEMAAQADQLKEIASYFVIRSEGKQKKVNEYTIPSGRNGSLNKSNNDPERSKTTSESWDETDGSNVVQGVQIDIGDAKDSEYEDF